MTKTAGKEYARISKTDYARFKKLERYFEPFLDYVEHLRGIKEARRDVKEGRTIDQEKLFRQLGM